MLVLFHALSVKSVSSVLPEAKQTVPEVGGGCHCTTRDIPLHIASYFCERCARLDQAEDVPNPQPQIAMAIRDSLNELGRAKSEPSRGA